MKIMKRIFCATLVAAMALAMTACGGASSVSAPTPAAPSEAPAASSTAPEKETYIELTDDLGAEEYGVGFRNGDVAFGLEVQKYLDEMIADGTAAEISQRWFGTDALFKNMDFIEEAAATADDKSLETIKSKGKFIVGLDDSYPPMGFRDDKNEIVGFDIDLAKEVAKRMGVEIEFQPIDWDSKELELNAGKIDCIWNGMTITTERVQNMFFTKPYIANQQIIIVPASSGITEKAQLEGKIVGLQKGSSSLEALTSDPIGQKVKEIVEYPDNVSAYMDLQAGRIDVFVVDSVVGRYVIAQNAQ